MWLITIDQLNEGAFTLDAQGVVLFSNIRFAELLKDDIKGIVGKMLSRWVVAEDQSSFGRLLKMGLEGSAKGEIRLRGRDDVLPVELSLRQLHTVDGSTVVTAVALDLRERKRSIESLRETFRELDGKVAELQVANEALRQINEQAVSTRNALETERQRYIELFDFAPDGYLVTDPRAVIRGANQAASLQLQVPARELVRAPLVLFVDLHDRQAFLHTLAQFMPTHAERLDAADLVITMQPRNGDSFVAALKVGAIREANGQLGGLRWLIRDVSNLVRAEREIRQLNTELELHVAERTKELETANLFLQGEIEERKRAEDALRASEERFRIALGDSPITVFGQDRDLRYTSVYNPPPGFTTESLVGELESDVLPESAGRLAEIKRSVLESGIGVRTETFICEGGETRYYDLTVEPRRDAQGEIVGIMCAAVDITEARRIQQEIEKLNRDLERQKTELEMVNRELESFSYSVSHDLRAPLATIDGFSRLLSKEYAAQLPEAGQRFLRLIHENAETLQRLIDNLLAFSRSARQPLKKQEVAPGEVAAQALQELRGSCEGRQVEIVLGEMPPCAADPGLLKQVYLNLLSNAIKFTRKREVARIEIGCAVGKGEEESAYFVKDNGVGFDPERAEHLFGVFQRLHSEEEYEGTGVGLAIVERIVKRHGGRVWADAAVEQGATFYFTLPWERLARGDTGDDKRPSAE